MNRIFQKLSGDESPQNVYPKSLTVLTKGGIPLTSSSADDVLQGGLYAAITSFASDSFQCELNHIRIGRFLVFFKRTKHLLGSLIVESKKSLNPKIIEVGLNGLLEHLENNCPEFEREKYDHEKIDDLINQYIVSLL